MNRILPITLLLAALLSGGIALAKRSSPPVVEPVIVDGVRYTAPNDDGRRAYVEAWDTAENRKLCEVTVFRNPIDPAVEEDVQHVYLRQMIPRGGMLMVVAEDDRVYRIDLKTRVVDRLEKLPPEAAGKGQ
jgi:hypothetical protein